MNTKILEQLDYFRIRQDIAGFCMSEEGRNALLQVEPFTDNETVSRIKEEAFEWMRYMNSASPQALVGWLPVADFFSLLPVEGAALELESVYALGKFCQAVAQVRERVEGAVASGVIIPHLAAIVAKLPSLDAPSSEIFRIVDASGQLRDLPEIRAIRSSILHIRRDIDLLVRHYTSDPQLRDVLQSDVPVLRADRQVLAVRANFRGRIRGIVHEVSQSGQTVYIEPDDVVSRGNDLIQEEARLHQEVRRILRELTGKLGAYHDDFVFAHEIMVKLDMRYGAARWGVENHCTFAFACRLDDDGGAETGNTTAACVPVTQVSTTTEQDSEFLPPLLLRARHPLLGDRAVPVDVRFLSGKRVLIVTGPNTGGKTVTLKTIALFALLNQSGFPVPAAEGTRLPVFNNIFADIGDDQSLDQSLSTFSGHMKNIAESLAGADSRSLVLLDELGSGTDPQEGGAIGMAVLDYLIKKRAFVLVTTHHGILKNYGYTHPLCINASVEFDESTLAPTYRILMGVPGESHALDIARRSGLLPEVADKAASYLSSEQADVSALIKGLTAKHAELDRLERESHQKEKIINEKRRNVDLKDLRLRQKEVELRKDGCRESRKFLDENRKMLENLVRELREGEVTRDKTLKVKETIAILSEAVKVEELSAQALAENTSAFALEVAQNEELQKKKDSTYEREANSNGKKGRGGVGRKKQRMLKQAEEDALLLNVGSAVTKKTDHPVFESGMEVITGTKGTRGTLIAPAKKGYWFVQIGSLRMTLKEKDLIPSLDQKKISTAPSVSVELLSNESESSGDGRVSFEPVAQERAVFELRLLGMHYDDAMKALTRQLDLAALQGLHNFSIIHGKGYGVLQKAVQDVLKKYPGVSDFHFASPEDGGSGKTYVTLA